MHDLAATHATEFGITDVDEVRSMVTEHHKLGQPATA
jgi:hypothetical protein